MHSKQYLSTVFRLLLKALQSNNLLKGQPARRLQAASFRLLERNFLPGLFQRNSCRWLPCLNRPARSRKDAALSKYIVIAIIFSSLFSFAYSKCPCECPVNAEYVFFFCFSFLSLFFFCTQLEERLNGRAPCRRGDPPWRRSSGLPGSSGKSCT